MCGGPVCTQAPGKQAPTRQPKSGHPQTWACACSFTCMSMRQLLYPCMQAEEALLAPARSPVGDLTLFPSTSRQAAGCGSWSGGAWRNISTMQATQLRFSAWSGLSSRTLAPAPTMQPAAALTRSGKKCLWEGHNQQCASGTGGRVLSSVCGAPAAGLPRQFTVEAKQMTRRESVEKRHKRIRSKVGGGGRAAARHCGRQLGQLGCLLAACSGSSGWAGCPWHRWCRNAGRDMPQAAWLSAGGPHVFCMCRLRAPPSGHAWRCSARTTTFTRRWVQRSVPRRKLVGAEGALW